MSRSRSVFLSYKNARDWARAQELTSGGAFHRLGLCRPDNIPSNPNIYYGEQWVSWGEFLGNGRVANQLRRFCSYDEAQTWAISLGIRSRDSWRAMDASSFPNYIPRDPVKAYKSQWCGWKAFLCPNGLMPLPPSGPERTGFERRQDGRSTRICLPTSRAPPIVLIQRTGVGGVPSLGPAGSPTRKGYSDHTRRHRAGPVPLVSRAEPSGMRSVARGSLSTFLCALLAAILLNGKVGVCFLGPGGSPTRTVPSFHTWKPRLGPAGKA
jgi:hypothetical protein